MSTREKKDSAIANDLKVVSAPHACAVQNVGLYAGAAGTVDLTTSEGRLLTGIPVGANGILPLQVQSVEATTISPLYELILR